MTNSIDDNALFIHYQISRTHCWQYELQSMSYKVWATEYELPSMSYRVWATEYELPSVMRRAQ